VVAGGSVWALDWVGLVHRIDPDLNEASADRIPIDTESGTFVVALAVGEDSLWTGDTVGILTRISLASLEVIDTIDVGVGIFGVAAAGGLLWVVAFDGRVLRVDPATGSTEAVLEIEGEPRAIGAGPATIWIGWMDQGGQAWLSWFDYAR